MTKARHVNEQCIELFDLDLVHVPRFKGCRQFGEDGVEKGEMEKGRVEKGVQRGVQRGMDTTENSNHECKNDKDGLPDWYIQLQRYTERKRQAYERTRTPPLQ